MRRAALLAFAFSAVALSASAAPKPKPSGQVTVKNGEQLVEKRGKKPLGHVFVRHLDMAVAIDAPSRALEAQLGAVSSRYATTRSITPGSPYVGGLQRNNVAGNLRDYNETELEAGLPVWLPGQRDAMEGTVSTGIIEVEAKLAQRRLEVAGVLRDSWWAAQRAAREVNVARSRVATAKEIGADMTRRVELGDAAPADALLARNELLAAETELAQAEGAEKVARVNYEAITGGTGPDGTLEGPKPASDIDEHPALRAPVAVLRRAEAQMALIDATPIDNPEVGVIARQEYNNQYTTDPSEPLSNQRTNSTTLGVRFRIPLPTPGRNEPRIAEARAEMERARAEYEKARRVVTADIQGARANLAAAQRAAGLSKQRLAVANEEFDLTRKSFALGEIGALDFYRVRQLQLDAQRSEAAASVAIGAAVSRLNQAQGYAP
jgi:outer membrane protein, heavy metal efflux system